MWILACPTSDTLNFLMYPTNIIINYTYTHIHSEYIHIIHITHINWYSIHCCLLIYFNDYKSPIYLSHNLCTTLHDLIHISKKNLLACSQCSHKLEEWLHLTSTAFICYLCYYRKKILVFNLWEISAWEVTTTHHI